MTGSVIKIRIPLVNPNEPDARLVSVDVSEGQQIRFGELICTLETTKATAEVLAELDGFIIGLKAMPGQMVHAGDTLCYIADSSDWKPDTASEDVNEPEDLSTTSGLQAGLRITDPARRLANESGIELSRLPVGPLVTESMVREILKQSTSTKEMAGRLFDENAVIVYGGGGHGKSVIELIRAMGSFEVQGIIDDGILPGESILGYPVLGDYTALENLFSQGIKQAVNAVGGIGDLRSRLAVFKRLMATGFVCPMVVHPTAVVEPSATISQGVQIFPHAYIGSDVQVGFGVIVNTGAIVSHDCQLEEYANLSPGAVLAGGVKIGKAVLIGMGTTINLGVKVGSGARIGNGATIKSDVPPDEIISAGGIWPNK